MIKEICQQCGKEFDIYPSQKGTRKYCSKACKFLFLHLHHKAPHLSEYNRTVNPMNKKADREDEPIKIKKPREKKTITRDNSGNRKKPKRRMDTRRKRKTEPEKQRARRSL